MNVIKHIIYLSLSHIKIITNMIMQKAISDKNYYK